MRRRRKASTGVREAKDHPWLAWLQDWTFPIMLGFAICFFVYTTGDSLLGKPRVYDALEARGVPAQATVDYTPNLFGGSKGEYYTLTVTFRGDPIAVRYEQNYAQFRSIPDGGLVDVLVDPVHPEDLQTVTDVRERTNAGIGPVAVFFAIGAILCLALLIGWVGMLRRFAAADSAEPSSWAPPTSDEGSEVVARENVHAVESIAGILRDAKTLPLSRDVRVEPAAIMDAVTRLRLFDGPRANSWARPDTQWRAASFRELIQSAPPVRLLGGVRVDRDRALERLGDLREAIERDRRSATH